MRKPSVRCQSFWACLPFAALLSVHSLGLQSRQAVRPEAASSTTLQDQWEALRLRMVDTQLRPRGIKNSRVLDAMARVPRHRFVPTAIERSAYEDRPLPIGFGQTISQPYIVAYMTEALQLTSQSKVLEVGTGSGYQAAVLAELSKEVYTIEIVRELGERARTTLASLGYFNVDVRVGDGYRGWPEHAPFDAIMVTAAPDHIPQPLIEQLAVGGRLVIPVGRSFQQMTIVTKTERGVVQETTLPVLFVPMTGEAQQRR